MSCAKEHRERLFSHVCWIPLFTYSKITQCSVSSPQSACITYRCRLSYCVNPWILRFWRHAIITHLLNTWTAFQNGNPSFFKFSLSAGTDLHKFRTYLLPFPLKWTHTTVETVNWISHTIWAKDIYPKKHSSYHFYLSSLQITPL